MGHYSSQTQINARGQSGATIRVTSQAIIEVPLFRYGTQSGRLEQVYLPKIGMAWGGVIILGSKCVHYSSHPWAIIYVKPGVPGQVKGTSVNHYYM